MRFGRLRARLDAKGKDNTSKDELGQMRDIVERLRSPANVFYEYAADNGAMLREAADEIERLRTELHEAHGYAGQLACSLRRKHFSELPPFELQPDLYGRLTQIDNMTCGMTRAALGGEE